MGYSVKVDWPVTGAYFRKVSSGQSPFNSGVKGKGTLPLLEFDPDRFFVHGEPGKRNYEHFQTGPLDRPSVYVGGNVQSAAELDVGLVWDRVYDTAGLATYTFKGNFTDGGDITKRLVRKRSAQDHQTQILVSGDGEVHATGKIEIDALLFNGDIVPNYGFRPYWRTIHQQQNTWHNPPIIRTGSQPLNVYLFPGQVFEMSLRVVGLHQLTFKVGAPGGEVCQVTFPQDRFGEGASQSFKRVNSIDQFRLVYSDGAWVRKGNEREIVIPTLTTAKAAEWEFFNLIRSDGTEIPFAGQNFTEVRGGDTHSRYADIFKISNQNAQGRETLSITP